MKLKITIWLLVLIVCCFPQSAYSIDYDNYLNLIVNGSVEEQKGAQEKLFETLERIHLPLSHLRSFKEQLIFSDLDGDGVKECIAAVTVPPPSRSEVFIFKKNGKYDLVSHFDVGGIEKIQTINLTKPTVTELVIDSAAAGTWRYLYRSIYKWDGEKISLIWGGKVEDIFDDVSGENSYDIRANIQYIDVDKDGIKEIIREEVEKRSLFNEQTKKWDKLVSQKTVRRVYKWNPKEFKYKLLPER